MKLHKTGTEAGGALPPAARPPAALTRFTLIVAVLLGGILVALQQGVAVRKGMGLRQGGSDVAAADHDDRHPRAFTCGYQAHDDTLRRALFPEMDYVRPDPARSLCSGDPSGSACDWQSPRTDGVAAPRADDVLIASGFWCGYQTSSLFPGAVLYLDGEPGELLLAWGQRHVVYAGVADVARVQRVGAAHNITTDAYIPVTYAAQRIFLSSNGEQDWSGSKRLSAATLRPQPTTKTPQQAAAGAAYEDEDEGFLYYVSSNCVEDASTPEAHPPARERLFDALVELAHRTPGMTRPVSYGKCHGTHPETAAAGHGTAWRPSQSFTVLDRPPAPFLFELAADRLPVQGYLSEKLGNALADGVVPIYVGSRTAVNAYAAGAFVYAGDGTDATALQAAVRRVHHLWNNRTAYDEVRNAPAVASKSHADYWSLAEDVGGGKLRERIRAAVRASMLQ